MNTKGNQDGNWLKFYENAWDIRSQWMKDLIAKGETHPLRVIHSYENFELAYLLKRGPDNVFQYTKVDYKTLQQTKMFETAPNGFPEFRVTSLQDGFTVIPFTFQPGHTEYINAYLGQTQWDAVIELGCGYGQNLFKLYYAGAPKDAHYYGCEFTNSGVAMGKTLAAMDQNLKFSFHHFDHLNPDLGFLPAYKNVFVFTNHSLEQVNKITPDFFKTLSQVAENVVGLHLEPFGFQMGGESKIDVSQKKFIQSVNWNVNFVETIKAAQDLGYITINYLKKNMFPQFDPLNPTSVAWWQNKRA